MATAVLTLAIALVFLLALRFGILLRALGGVKASELSEIDTDRYRPMLRLLSDGYFGRTKPDRRTLAVHRAFFRQYLRELTADYGKLLAGLRLVMAESDMERPDLARMLITRRLSFAMAICRIEVYLLLHALGIVNHEILELEISGLFDAALVLRRLFPVESAVWGA